MRRPVGYVVGAVFGIVFVATCGQAGDTGKMDMGGMMFGDGSLFGDGAMLDIASADAQSGGTAMTANCDKVNTRTTTYSATTTSTTSTYFAEFTVPGIDPTTAPVLSAVVCGYQGFGVSGPPPIYTQCTGPTCQESGYVPPAGLCSQGGAYTVAGKVLVYCGAHTTTNSNGTITESGAVGQTAWLRVQ